MRSDWINIALINCWNLTYGMSVFCISTCYLDFMIKLDFFNIWIWTNLPYDLPNHYIGHPWLCPMFCLWLLTMHHGCSNTSTTHFCNFTSDSKNLYNLVHLDYNTPPSIDRGLLLIRSVSITLSIQLSFVFKDCAHCS